MKQTTQIPNNPSPQPQTSPQQHPESTPKKSMQNMQNQNQILGELTPHIITQVNSIQRCSSMTLIETPAVNYINSSYLQQIDAGIKSISKIILWTNGDQQMDEDQAEDQVSGLNQWGEGEGDRDSFGDDGDAEILFRVQGVQKSVEGLAKIPLLNYTLIKRQTHEKQDKSATIQKKSCNCKKTQCLKLYCDCFRENRKCQGCSCVDCHNTQQYSEQRKNAVLILTDRNPSAFKPKIEVQSRYHSKGCNCKKSNCMKKYCECYQAGLKCWDNCKCEDCKNCVVSKQMKSTGKRTLPFNFKLKKGQGPPIIIPIGASIQNITTNKDT